VDLVSIFAFREGKDRACDLSDFLVCVVLQEVVDSDYSNWYGLEFPFDDLLEGFHAELVVFPDLVFYAFFFAGPPGIVFVVLFSEGDELVSGEWHGVSAIFLLLLDY